MKKRTNQEAIDFVDEYIDLCLAHQFVIGGQFNRPVLYDITLANRLEDMSEDLAQDIIDETLGYMIESAENFEDRYAE